MEAILLHPQASQSVETFCFHALSSIVRLRGDATRRWQFGCAIQLESAPMRVDKPPTAKEGKSTQTRRSLGFDGIGGEPSLLFEWERLT